MASHEIITIVAGGYQWTAFTRITITYGAKKAVRAFAFSVTDSPDPIGEQWNFMPGTPVQVFVSGQLVVDGYIHQMSPSYDGTNHHVEISGDSKSADSTKASAEHKTGEFKKKTLGEVAKELDKQGVGYKAKDDTPKVPIFRLNPGENVFDAVERLARKYQRLLVGQPDGSVSIEKGGKEMVHAPLVEGVNILAASATFSDKGKNSKYVVKGQRTFGTDKDALRIVGEATDPSVKRNLPKIILNETDVRDNKRAKKRAKHHKDRANGEGISARVTLQGARCDNGILWKPNTLVFVDSPMLKLGMMMLIDNVSITQDQSGTKTSLSLVHPKALGSEAKTGKNKPKKAKGSKAGSKGGKSAEASSSSTDSTEVAGADVWDYPDDTSTGDDDNAGADEGTLEGEEEE